MATGLFALPDDALKPGTDQPPHARGRELGMFVTTPAAVRRIQHRTARLVVE